MIKLNELSSLQNQKLKPEEEDQGREYIFNDFTAGAYQEFDVLKINRYKAKKERTLGIDRYHIYNDLPKTKEKSIFNLFSNSTKKPLRKTKDIVNCGYLTTRMFFIDLKDEGKTKQIIYEVKNANIRNEIISKIKYIMVN